MKRLLVPGLILAVVMTAVTSCSPPPAKPPPPPKVTVRQPLLATVTNWDEYPGHLEAVQMVEVRSRVAGYIESIHFQDGAEVKAGDLLFVIDPRPFQAQLDRAVAQRQQAETHLELTQRDLKRAEGLRGTKAISEEEYDSRRNAAQEAEAALTGARATETTARIDLDYTQIKAPIAGRIGRRLVTPGNFVQLQGNNGASTLLATIVSERPIYCYFDAQEEAYLRYCKDGNRSASLRCELALASEQGFPHIGQVDFVDNQVDPRTGTIRMRAVFANEDGALIPGLFANVRVPAGQPAQALLVPDVAVGSDQDHKFVFVVNKENIVETRSVEVGRADGTRRSILSGLSPEDRVVVNGLMMIRPGAKVQVEAQESAGQTPNDSEKPKPSS
jgi:RND family efflux transporter MFP subunit